MQKITLVGELNPYGSDEQYALVPFPDHCAGHKLCCRILGMRRATYMDVFHRVNLVHSNRWSVTEARAAAKRLDVPGARLILLGAKVSHAFGLNTFHRLVAMLLPGGAEVLTMNHPSGLCRAWSEPGLITRTRDAIREWAPDVAPYIGEA